MKIVWSVGTRERRRGLVAGGEVGEGIEVSSNLARARMESSTVLCTSEQAKAASGLVGAQRLAATRADGYSKVLGV